MINKLRKLLRNNYFANKIKEAIIYLRFSQRKNKPITTIFNEIFKTNEWKSGESVSGTGSIASQTEVIRNILPEIITKYTIKTFLDAPCGDFNWMKLVDLGVKNYIGADIVDDLITRNNSKYSNAVRSFMTLDITRDTLPEADILFCRDCLVHMSYADIRRVIDNLKVSRIKYLLTTTFIERTININIPTGSWRPINLQKEPFNFPVPIYLINEKCSQKQGLYNDKSIALWLIKDL